MKKKQKLILKLITDPAFVNSIIYELSLVLMNMENLHAEFLKSKGLSTDSRSILSGQIFIAISGPNFNGNQFAAASISKGAMLAVIDDKKYQTERTILVDDTLKCLQDLARFHRKYLNIPIIGLTGSNGKTTTKELINAVLSTQYKVSATIGNLNNHLGVPLSLLKLTESDELGIIEMGANHVGEIAVLSDIAQPDLGLITNIGKAHLEGFGSLGGVLKGKTELYRFLRRTGGLIFVERSDKKLMKASENYQRVQCYTDQIQKSLASGSLFLSFQYDKTKVSTNLTGDYNLANIKAAISIGEYFKISKSNMLKAVANYKPENKRSQLLKKDGINFIVDCYNANPISMEKSLINFFNADTSSKYLILGDMLELGKSSKIEHQQIVEQIIKEDFDGVFLVGEEFGKLNKESKNSIQNNRINYFNHVEALKAYLKTNPFKKNSLVLLKGSRGIGLERILP